jgi:hypothetical protein
MPTFIVRFEDDATRDAFVRKLRKISKLECEVGEFLPDVIVRNVPEQSLPKLRRLAPGARFMPDFGHDLLEGKARRA